MNEPTVRQAEVETSWDAIDQECSGFRNGFVDTFLKYKDRPLRGGGKVTQAAFAEHFRIAPSTFGDWVRARGHREKVFRPRATNADTAEDGWDLPGVPAEVSDQWRKNIERNEQLIKEGCLRCPYHC